MDTMKQLKRSLMLALVFISFSDIDIVSSQMAPAKGDCNNTWITMTNMSSVGGTLYSAANGNATACYISCLAQPTCTGIDYDGASQCWWTYTPPVYDPTHLVTHFMLLRGLNSCNGSCFNGTSAGWVTYLNSHVIGGVNNSAALTVEACLQICQPNISCNGFVWNAASTPSCFLIFNSSLIQTQQNLTYFQKNCGVAGFQLVTPNFITGANGGSSAMYISSSSTVPQSPTTFFAVSPSSKNPGNEASGLQVMTSLWIVTSVALFGRI
jgi:hypothetical protein